MSAAGATGSAGAGGASATAAGAGGRRSRDVAVPVLLEELDQPREAGMGGHQLAGPTLEQRAPLARDRLGILEVLLEERAGEACVQAVYFVHAHTLCCTTGIPSRRGSILRLSTAGGR